MMCGLSVNRFFREKINSILFLFQSSFLKNLIYTSLVQIKLESLKLKFEETFAVTLALAMIRRNKFFQFECQKT